MGKIRKIMLLVLGFTLTVLFQNCGDELNLTEIQQASESTDPSVSILAPAAYVENTNYTLTALVANLDNPVFSWYKDGELIAGEDTANLSFSPIELTDAGTYEVRALSGIELVTSSVLVAVTADPNAPATQVFTDTFFALNGQNYYIYRFNNQPVAGVMTTADNFCKSRVGANSTLVNYVLNAAPQLTQRYAYFTDVATCNASNFRQGYIGGHCLAFINANVQLTRFQSVECSL